MTQGNWIAVACLCACLVSGCATSKQDQEEMQRERVARDVQDELTVGRQIAAKLLGHMGSYEGKPEAYQYVNLVGQALATQSGRPELAFHFGVLQTDEINAYATPGGFVFVTRGLLKLVRSESELACILGHEIAHVNEKHMYNAIAPKRDVSATESVARMVSGGKSDIGASLSTMVTAGMKMLLEDGLGKEKEYAADEGGVLYAANAGYDPKALHVLLKRIADASGSGKVGKTHPPFPERLDALDRYVESNGVVALSPPNSKVMDRRFKAALSEGL